MENLDSAVETLVHGSNTLFLLMGAAMVLAMHAGFAFLEVGTVRHKNQVNALSKIITDFAMSALAYFFIGYWVAYGVTFLSRQQPDRREWLWPGQVLLPAYFRCGDSGDHLRWHRRAGTFRPPAVRHRTDRGVHLSVLRGHRLER